MRALGAWALLSWGAAAWPETAPPTSAAARHLEEWQHSTPGVSVKDFAELGHYRAANARLPPPAAGEGRVVFFGDSITEAWPLERDFPGKPYVNRGISGQTTSQLLLRLREDVIDLGARAVVILAGTNDIAGNTGPISLQEIEENFEAMAELARANGLRVVFSSILPVHNHTPGSEENFEPRPPETIVTLNHWLERYCRANGLVYLDYFAAMVDEHGLMRRELADKGLHPNAAGYAVMAPLAARAIERALAGAGAAPQVPPRR
ncbi:MAG TPA: SGNH/GDSL hydrolase family protein [Polyangia bacterium]|nr:SGNH/GDSL hydrolase family protein [Polyangia bacterium]